MDAESLELMLVFEKMTGTETVPGGHEIAALQHIAALCYGFSFQKSSI